MGTSVGAGEGADVGEGNSVGDGDGEVPQASSNRTRRGRPISPATCLPVDLSGPLVFIAAYF